MTSVFLSHARDDGEPFFRRLYEDLTAAGLDIWLGRVSLPSRQLTSHQEIADGIRERDRLVLVVGPNAFPRTTQRRDGVGRSPSRPMGSRVTGITFSRAWPSPQWGSPQ